MDNPRFPHKCKIYRTEGETEFSAGTEITVYEGECRKYRNGQTRQTDEVMTGNYCLSIPGERTNADGVTERIMVKALAGDTVEATDYSGTYRGYVVDCRAGNLGNTVYWNDDKN